MGPVPNASGGSAPPDENENENENECISELGERVSVPRPLPHPRSSSSSSSISASGPSSTDPLKYHSQTMSQLTGTGGRVRSSLTGPRPLPSRTPSNPPVAPMAVPTTAPSAPGERTSQPPLPRPPHTQRSSLAPPSLSASTSTHTSMLYAETAESDTSRHTEIPPHTIRELEKTLQDLADLPASAPRRADPPPPLIPPAQLAPIILDDAPLFTEPLWAGVNTTMSPEQTPALNSAFAHDPLSSTSAPSSATSGAATPSLPSAGSMSTSAGVRSKAPRLSLITTSLTPPDKAELHDRDPAPLSPGMKHWQQVREHVLAPTPLEERAANTLAARPPAQGHRGLKYVANKAAGRFGFRSAVENVMGHDRRGSQFGGYSFGPNITAEEREEASRARRRFARDVKVCLDGCSIEESSRRLSRIGPGSAPDTPNDLNPRTNTSATLPTMRMGSGGARSIPPPKSTKGGWTFQGHGGHGTAQPGTPPLHPELATSTYAPLLTQLHRYLPDARAKRLWCRTCPHHATILAELGVAFLQDGVSSDAERVQALEVFGTVVRNWATDSADEELDRWLWLCRAMLVEDRPLRQRGLTLLQQLLQQDPSLPEPLVRPMSADDFEAITIALLRLLHALETSPAPNPAHQEIVNRLLAALGHGLVVKVDLDTLADVTSEIDMPMSIDALERELLWMAAGRALRIDPDIAVWLLADDARVLKRYIPAPILSITSPVLIHLRVVAATQYFSSLSTTVRSTSNRELVGWVAATADYVFNGSHTLKHEDSLVAGYVTVLLDIELRQIERRRLVDDDPFTESKRTADLAAAHSRLLQLLKDSPKTLLDTVAEQLVASYPMTQRLAAVRYFLDTDLIALGRACVPYVLRRLTPAAGENKNVNNFLPWLSKTHPQLFYKPLFNLSAATQTTTLAAPRRIVTTLAALVGADRFWTSADPQMIVIVLMGGAGGAPKMLPNGEIVVKAGRYATMLELVVAMRSLKSSRKPAAALRTFLTTLETRLATMLELEEKTGRLPVSYRSLTCQLFDAIRNASHSMKRTALTRLAAAWFGHSDHETAQAQAQLTSPLPPVSADEDEDQSVPLRDLLSVEDKEVFLPAIVILDMPLTTSLSTLLVTIQASTNEEDWAIILPHLWKRFSQPSSPNLQMTFLLTKCAEQVPEVLHTIVMNDLFRSTDSTAPLRTLLKLCMLYGYRYQLLSQPTIFDEDRGMFKFSSSKVSEFVATEMGSDQWVVPRDALDEALQKYGQALPLDLRQRLMELGWSEDKEMTNADYERVPVTAIPLSELSSKTDGCDEDKPPPPKPGPPAPPTPSQTGLFRTLSNSSNTGPKPRRPVLPPILMQIANEQTRLLVSSDDMRVVTLALELLHMVEREDPGALIRPINDEIAVDIGGVVKRLNSDVARMTPGFAYMSINSLAGYLKAQVRDNAQFKHWARVLCTVARVVPHVSEMSLRGIRKSKVETVLLPGSIFEDSAGFKLHAPWQGQGDKLAIQTAQLLLLTELLRTNPRDVYLIKKLLFNLHVQASFADLAFARAWLELVVQLFTGLNSNYNDRSEFRHFLNNIVVVLAMHGTTDMIVAVQGMLAMSVCAVRFRRVFASIGFVNITRTIYHMYVGADAAIKDCIEYAMRSIFRIHRDVFVYQVCLGMAEDPFDPKAAYKLLQCLSVPNSPTSGVASGIRGLNEKQEVDALVQMLSHSVEMSVREIGSSKEERRAEKASTVNLGPVTFPLDNIIRLLTTVIAVNAASPRALKLLRLFARLTPYITEDPKSRELLPDGVDAIGRFIHREKIGNDQGMLRLIPTDESTVLDWLFSSREYLLLVDATVKAGCELSVHATRRLLDIILNLHQKHPDTIGRIGSSVLGELARRHLSGPHPAEFLRDIAPTYRQTLADMDFSGVLESIAGLIRNSSYTLPSSMAALIVHEYVAPVIRMLAFASEENMAFIVPVRAAAVDLIAASLFLPGSETLEVLEGVTSSPGLFASVILPLVLVLDKPADANREEAYTSFWIRILRLVMHPMSRARAPKSMNSPSSLAAMAVLSVQIVKVVVLRAPECMSATPGLWSYIAAELLKMVADGDGRFYTSVGRAPRVVDWMMWSLFELLVLHRMPLHIDCRVRIQGVLAGMVAAAADSRPSSVGSDAPRPSPLSYSQSHTLSLSQSQASSPSASLLSRTPSRSLSGLVRRPSARIRTPSATSGPGIPSPITPSFDTQLTPAPGTHSRTASGTSTHLQPAAASRSVSASTASSTPLRRASANLSASLGPGGLSGGPIGSPLRPSFSDISARRASRPTFDVFPGLAQASPGVSQPETGLSAALGNLGGNLGSLVGVGSPTRHKRFPSSAPVRALTVQGQAEKSAIVHLLGPATHLFSATSAGVALNVGLHDPRRNALRDVRVSSPQLVASARRAVATTMAVYGYPSALVGATDEDVPMLQVWSVPDALRAVAEQTAVFVEDQFRDVFNPRERAAAGAEALSAWTAGDAAANTSVVSTPGPADKDKAADGLATIDEKDDDGSFYTARENGDPDPDDTGDGRHPSFSFTLQGAYDEPAFQTYSVNDEGRRESVSVPILSVSHFT